jgi:hypothetical protein
LRFFRKRSELRKMVEAQDGNKANSKQVIVAGIKCKSLAE